MPPAADRVRRAFRLGCLGFAGLAIALAALLFLTVGERAAPPDPPADLAELCMRIAVSTTDPPSAQKAFSECMDERASP